MKAAILNQTHADYDDDMIEDYAALYEGGKAFHARVARFLPKNAQEPAELYTDRKSRATYENLGGPLVDMIGAWLFSKPAVIEGVEEDWLEDVDRAGTAWGDWWRAVFTDALIAQRGWAWMDLPARGDVPVTSLADEKALGLREPYLTRIRPHDVRNWGEDDLGRLTWCMVRTTFCRQLSPLEPQQRVIRWRLIDATTIRTWEWIERPDHPLTTESDVTELAAIDHNIGAMPVVRLALPAGLWAMAKLADPLLALTRTTNDHDWTLHVSAHALMTITSADGAGNPPTLGPGYYLSLCRDANGADAVGYAEPGGASNAARMERIADLRDAVHRAVQQMAASQATDTATSAASKMADWAALEVMLSAYASLVRTAMERVLDRVAAVMSIADPKVSGLAGWHEADLAEMVATYNLAEPAVKSETFRRTMAKRLATAFLPDALPAVQEAIAAEIDAADYADVPVYAPALPPVV